MCASGNIQYLCLIQPSDASFLCQKELLCPTFWCNLKMSSKSGPKDLQILFKWRRLQYPPSLLREWLTWNHAKYWVNGRGFLVETVMLCCGHIFTILRRWEGGHSAWLGWKAIYHFVQGKHSPDSRVETKSWDSLESNSGISPDCF